MSSSNLLKTFGAGAAVAQQLATDKALRRKSTGVIRGFDMADGELIKDASLGATSPTEVPHNLGRVPEGAVVLKVSDLWEVACTATSLSSVTIRHSAPDITVTLWVV